MTNINATASNTRYEAAVMEMARERMLRSSPTQQAETIAKHYAAHAEIALEILRLIRLRHYADDTKDVDAAIRLHIDAIKLGHRHDLGIEPEWPQKEPGEAREMNTTNIKDAIMAALRGETSTAVIYWDRYWDRQDARGDGPAYRVVDKSGTFSGELRFLIWASLDYHMVTYAETMHHSVRDYFGGPDGRYTGPDANGIYPVLIYNPFMITQKIKDNT